MCLLYVFSASIFYDDTCLSCLSRRYTGKQITDMGSAVSTNNDAVVGINSDPLDNRNTTTDPKPLVRITLSH